MPRDYEAELDKYISDVADVPSDAVVNDGETNGDVSGDTGQQQSGSDTSLNGAPSGETSQAPNQAADQAAPRQEPTQDKNKQQSQSVQAPDTKQLRPLGDGTFADPKGNIVDKDGKVIAESGFAARVYNTARRQKQMLEERDQELMQLRTQLGERSALTQAVTQYGLDNNDLAQAIDLAGRMKRGDVLGVTRDVVALAVAQGYNVTDLLGKDVGDTIEMKAMRQMIDERLAPVTRQAQQEQAMTEAQQRGVQAYQQFVRQNEFADVHADDIVKVMQREGVHPQQAYNRLLAFANRNGLDFTQPLAPQVQARIQERQQQQPNQQNRQNSQKPMPNGAATTRPNGAVPSVIPMASADDDWGSIISEVQRTVGQVN